MVEIPTSSCDKVSAKDAFAGSYSFLERGSRVVNLFTRSKKDGGEYEATSEEHEELEPVLAPELVSLLARNSLPHLRETIGGHRSNTDNLSRKDGNDRDMVLSRHDSDSSREFIYKTPAEFASNCTLSTTSPELRLREFEQEFAKLRAERTRQRTALRQQVLSEIDIPAKLESGSSPSTSILVPRNIGPISENDDRSSLSSRSSEENLTFQDATEDFNDDEDSKTESDEKKNTSSSKSVDFSFLHSVYRTKGKHEEAILLSMKYAGNTGLRTDQDDGVDTPDTNSSNSIIGTVPPRAETKLFKEYANMIRETMRKCETGATKYRFQERTTAPDVQSVSVSGSTTPQQQCDRSSNLSYTPTSNKMSKTSLDTESPSRVLSLPQSPSTSSQSSPSVSRPASPPPGESRSNLSSETSPESFNGYPDSESPIVVPQRSDSRESFNKGQESVKQSKESPLFSRNTEHPSSIPPQRHVTYSPDFHDYHSESLNHYPISDTGTEDDWLSTARSDTSGKSSRRKHPLDIPITLDGRIVYPEVIFAEDTQAAQTRGPLGLLDKVKSFAKTCGPCNEEMQPGQSPVQSTFSEGNFIGGKASAKLNTALLSRLVCVECGILCTPPVAMCVWGHIVCEECRPVGLWENQASCWCRKRCPQCSGDMLSRPCELWTNIARSLLYPCRFISNGCRESQGLTPTEKILHEDSCRWRQLQCRCTGCSWRGVWHQMKAHVTQVHLPKATRADWYRFVAVNGATPIGRSSDVIALPANELVLLHSLAVIGEHRYLLQYLSDDGGGGAVLFVPRFKLRVISSDGKSEVEVRGEAVPIQHDVERALRSGRCFRLSGTPFGREPVSDSTTSGDVTVQLCLEKGRLSVL